jgi:hypothetical protein
MSDQLQLDLNISPQESLWRLSSTIDEERIKVGFGVAFAGTRDIIGKIDGNQFRVRRRPRHRSSFITFLTGVVEPLGNGSRVTASFPKSSFRVAKIILMILGTLIFVPILLAAIIALVAWLSGNRDVATIAGIGLLFMVPFAAVFFTMLAIFGGMIMFGRHKSKSDKVVISEFVRSIYRDVTVAG